MEAIRNRFKTGGIFNFSCYKGVPASGFINRIRVLLFGNNSLLRSLKTKKTIPEWLFQLLRIRLIPGELKWVEETHNLITNEGLDKILDSTVHNDASATWYIGLIEASHDYAAGDTYAIPGHTESTSYDEATRVEYEEAAASSQSTTNSANKATFTISATKTIYGGFLADFATKGNTAEVGKVLLCGGLFAASRDMVDDDVLNVTYTITSADDGV